MLPLIVLTTLCVTLANAAQPRPIQSYIEAEAKPQPELLTAPQKLLAAPLAFQYNPEGNVWRLKKKREFPEVRKLDSKRILIPKKYLKSDKVKLSEKPKEDSPLKEDIAITHEEKNVQLPNEKIVINNPEGHKFNEESGNVRKEIQSPRLVNEPRNVLTSKNKQEIDPLFNAGKYYNPILQEPAREQINDAQLFIKPITTQPPQIKDDLESLRNPLLSAPIIPYKPKINTENTFTIVVEDKPQPQRKPAKSDEITFVNPYFLNGRLTTTPKPQDPLSLSDALKLYDSLINGRKTQVFESPVVSGGNVNVLSEDKKRQDGLKRPRNIASRGTKKFQETLKPNDDLSPKKNPQNKYEEFPIPKLPNNYDTPKKQNKYEELPIPYNSQESQPKQNKFIINLGDESSAEETKIPEHKEELTKTPSLKPKIQKQDFVINLDEDSSEETTNSKINAGPLIKEKEQTNYFRTTTLKPLQIRNVNARQNFDYNKNQQTANSGKNDFVIKIEETGYQTKENKYLSTSTVSPQNANAAQNDRNDKNKYENAQKDSNKKYFQEELYKKGSKKFYDYEEETKADDYVNQPKVDKYKIGLTKNTFEKQKKKVKPVENKESLYGKEKINDYERKPKVEDYKIAFRANNYKQEPKDNAYKVYEELEQPKSNSYKPKNEERGYQVEYNKNPANFDYNQKQQINKDGEKQTSSFKIYEDYDEPKDLQNQAIIVKEVAVEPEDIGDEAESKNFAGYLNENNKEKSNKNKDDYKENSEGSKYDSKINDETKDYQSKYNPKLNDENKDYQSNHNSKLNDDNKDYPSKYNPKLSDENEDYQSKYNSKLNDENKGYQSKHNLKLNDNKDYQSKYNPKLSDENEDYQSKYNSKLNDENKDYQSKYNSRLNDGNKDYESKYNSRLSDELKDYKLYDKDEKKQRLRKEQDDFKDFDVYDDEPVKSDYASKYDKNKYNDDSNGKEIKNKQNNYDETKKSYEYDAPLKESKEVPKEYTEENNDDFEETIKKYRKYKKDDDFNEKSKIKDKKYYKAEDEDSLKEAKKKDYDFYDEEPRKEKQKQSGSVVAALKGSNKKPEKVEYDEYEESGKKQYKVYEDEEEEKSSRKQYDEQVKKDYDFYDEAPLRESYKKENEREKYADDHDKSVHKEGNGKENYKNQEDKEQNVESTIVEDNKSYPKPVISEYKVHEKSEQDAQKSKSDAKKEGKKDAPKNEDHEHGGGKKFEAEHKHEYKKKGEKGYEGKHANHKAEVGHHAKEDHQEHHKDAGGNKKNHHDLDGYHGKHDKADKGEKGAKYDEEGGHEKGHSTHGTHNVHKKDEFEKKEEFYDEYIEDGDFDKSGGFFDEDDFDKGDHFKKSHKHAGEHHDHYGHKDEYEKGDHFKEDKGHKELDGLDVHHGHIDDYHKKVDKIDHKKVGYHNEHGSDEGKKKAR